MTQTVLLLIERELTAGDAERLVTLHPDEPLHYQVLMPTDARRNMLVDIIDHLSLLELREALDAVRGAPDLPSQEVGPALRASVEHLRDALQGVEGAQAAGELVDGEPVAELAHRVGQGDVREVIVVTRPHAVEDTFHRDWASRARQELGVPVLHVYAGSTFLG